MSSISSVKYSLEITVYLSLKGCAYFHYYATIIILVENGLKTAISSLIVIISGTIYHPAKFVIVTGLQGGNCGFPTTEPLPIGNEVVERASSFTFLDVTVSEDMSWGKNNLYHSKGPTTPLLPQEAEMFESASRN